MLKPMNFQVMVTKETRNLAVVSNQPLACLVENEKQMIIDKQILTIKRRQETEEGSDAEIEKGKNKQRKNLIGSDSL